MGKSVQSLPADGAATPRIDPQSLLAPLRIEIDRVLEQLPVSRIEARRLITREWSFDPSPKELQAVVRVAHDPAGDGPIGELARWILTARILIDRKTRPVLDGWDMDESFLKEVTSIGPELTRIVNALQHQASLASGAKDPDDRNFLRQVCTALMPSLDSLLATQVIAPHLLSLAGTTCEDDIRQRAPSMAQDELPELLRLARSLALPAGTVDRSGSVEPDSICSSALILRLAIEEDLQAWEADESPGEERDDEALNERLNRDRAAYYGMTGRIQGRQDLARLLGSTAAAGRLRAAQERLLEVYPRLAAALNAEPSGHDAPDQAATPIASLESLLAESAEHDARVDTELASRPVEEELYLDWLRKSDDPPPRPVAACDPYDRDRERLRIRILSVAAVVMLLACAAVWAQRMTGSVNSLSVPLEQVSDTLILENATSVGPMMYAEVSHWSWDDMTAEERLGSVTALGLSAQNQGYESVYLVDENREQLATWTAAEGAVLIAEPAEEERGS